MSRLEIIHLRTSGKRLASLGTQISESLRPEVDSSEVVTMYRRDGLETDVAIHIRGHKGPASKGSSALGLHLASALRAYGLVEHTLWEELTPVNQDARFS